MHVATHERHLISRYVCSLPQTWVVHDALQLSTTDASVITFPSVTEVVATNDNKKYRAYNYST
jgi:hypothetical protein